MVLDSWVGDVGVKLTEHICTTKKCPDERAGQKMIRIVVTDPYATDSDDGEGSQRFVRRVKRHVEQIYFVPPIRVEDGDFELPKKEIEVREAKKEEERSDGEEINFGSLGEQQKEIVVRGTNKFGGLCQDRMSAAFYRGTYDGSPEGAVRIYDIATLNEAARFYDSCDSEEGRRRLILRKKKHIEEVDFRPLPQEQMQVQETKKESLVSLLGDDVSWRKKVRGVHQMPSLKWSAKIRDSSPRKNLYFGACATPEDVERIFVRAAIKLRSFNAISNFSTTDVSIDRSQIKSGGEMSCKYSRPNPGDDIRSTMKLRGVRQRSSGRWGGKKFRGVRQRPSGSRGAETPDPNRRRMLPIKKRHVAEINFGPPQPHQHEIEVQETKKKSVVSSGDNVSEATNWTYSLDDEEGRQRCLPIKKRHVEEINFRTP